MKNVKKWIGYFCMVFALAMILPSALPETAVGVQTQAASVKLSASKLTLTTGQSHTLKVMGTKSKVMWSSSNKKVATVSGGKVKALKEGSAVITAKAGKKKLTCKVTVRSNYKELYRAFLEKGTASYNTKYSKGTFKIKAFALIDIDQNGTPDLIVSDGNASSTFTSRSVYTVKSGKVVYCGCYSVRGDKYFYYNKKYKSLYTWWWTNGVGGSGCQLYRLSGSKLNPYKYVWEGSDRPGSSKRYYYYGTSGEKNSKVSKSKYLSMAKKYFKGQKKYSFVNNTEANRKSKL